MGPSGSAWGRKKAAVRATGGGAVRHGGMTDPADRNTPTVPTDRFAVLAAIRRDPVTALRVHGSGREIELPADRPRLTVGASPTCDIVLEDEYVSAAHCNLERREPDRLLVRDRRSKNGCFINGNRVELAELRPGAILTIGSVSLLALGQRARARPSAREALVGRAPTFRAAVDRAMVAAASSCNVLLVGETGTGKELFARAIHEVSSRALGPFVPVNCGAIPAELVESELFGHEKGAFTGATSERDGVFAQADGGTLFLDELGELPMVQQVHLLRALESRHIRRVGGNRERQVDIRLVAATNRLDVDRQGSPLRTDLFHRVATLTVELPPLRTRREDIPLLVDSFLAELVPEFGPRSIGPDVLAALAEHPWPGNVRELRHAVHRGTALSSHTLRLEDLLPRRGDPIAELPLAEPTPPAGMVDAALRELLRDAYVRHGSVRRAAAALGLPKSTFADRARKLGIF
jgi:transcriptional regulator with AAA-type ATPase domain